MNNNTNTTSKHTKKLIQYGYVPVALVYIMFVVVESNTHSSRALYPWLVFTLIASLASGVLVVYILTLSKSASRTALYILCLLACIGIALFSFIDLTLSSAQF